jgi:hypothetical protein
MSDVNKRALFWFGVLMLLVVLDIVFMTALGTNASKTFTTVAATPSSAPPPVNATDLEVGIAVADITPRVGGKPVYLAGFGHNRKATGIRDPLKARAVVLKHQGKKIAVVSVDLVGFFRAHVREVRDKLPGFSYVLVSSTHNHEGPDTLGLWGPNPFTSGIDAEYINRVERQIVQAVHDADKSAHSATAHLGTVRAPELLHDGREPYVKHDELVAIRFIDAKGTPVGIVVQWNCHPETLGSKNTDVSTDFVGPAVRFLTERYRCPVVYLTGTVGGLMTSLHVRIEDEFGRQLPEESTAKTERYGDLVGQVAEEALKQSRPVKLTPFEVRSREVFLPMTNKYYQLGRQLGVLKRQAYLWTGDADKAEPADAKEAKKPLCLRTEVAWLRLGDLDVAAIPGEIYPELVLSRVQDPVDPAADFPDAPIEPGIYRQLRGPYRMLIGLANDEIGYIIPKRQWDEKPPFCYGRKQSQYGEVNSLGPDTAPILCKAFQELVKN